MAAADKFRGTATAAEVAEAVARAARGAGWTCDEAALADGGEGTLEALGGDPRFTTVRGPLGDPVEAEWRLGAGARPAAGGGAVIRPGGAGGGGRLDSGGGRLDGGGGADRAVIEMARASGLELAGGAEANDALRATTYGTGELIAAAIAAGARRIVVGVGGSATTDGGLGAVSALRAARLVHPGGPQRPSERGAAWAAPPVGLPAEVVVACDVTTLFVDAAGRFAPQKGATQAQVALLGRRLERLAQVYERDYGVDVRELVGSGAAGGLAGGLAALGAALVSGFDLVAAELDLAERVARADLVVTGEGHLDAESLSGKVVGGVVGLAGDAGVPVLVVAGEVDTDAVPAHWAGAPVQVVSLVDRFGPEQAMADTLGCVKTVVSEHLDSL